MQALTEYKAELISEAEAARIAKIPQTTFRRRAPRAGIKAIRRKKDGKILYDRRQIIQNVTILAQPLSIQVSETPIGGAVNAKVLNLLRKGMSIEDVCLATNVEPADFLRILEFRKKIMAENSSQQGFVLLSTADLEMIAREAGFEVPDAEGTGLGVAFLAEYKKCARAHYEKIGDCVLCMERGGACCALCVPKYFKNLVDRKDAGAMKMLEELGKKHLRDEPKATIVHRRAPGAIPAPDPGRATRPISAPKPVEDEVKPVEKAFSVSSFAENSDPSSLPDLDEATIATMAEKVPEKDFSKLFESDSYQNPYALPFSRV